MANGNPLRNEDFRKLLSTPAAARSGTQPNFSSIPSRSSSGGHGFTHKQSKGGDQKQQKKKSKYRPPASKNPKEQTETEQLYAETDARLHEIMNKYRDRAAERRKGEVDGQDIELRAKLTSGLKAFRDEDETLPEAERREQEIRESKFLGGDLDHTHLVKGLDYSLLNKARSEIKSKKEVVDEQEDVERAFQNPVSKHALLNKLSQSTLSRSVCRVLFETVPPIKNDLFQTKRMAYIVELEDNQTEVPVTLLRSTFECVSDRREQNMNADNMIINKLTEVLSYLRSDNKKKRKEVVKEVVAPAPNKSENIYDDAAEYVPNRESKSSRSERDKGNDRRNYFDDNRKTRGRSRSRSRERRRERSRDKDDRSSRKTERRSDSDKKPAPKVEHNPFPQTSAVLGTLPPEEPKPKKSRLDQDDAYGELFPNSEMFYGGDSDEEDFSKMDMGNKKGPVKRFDFDTEEDYANYQSKREANPKAAFQFGVKANSGRKTRKNQAAAMEKKLDKEYEAITKIWDKGTKPKANY